MSDQTLAKRYADAFLEYAEEGCGKVQALGELQELKRLYRDDQDFRTFLTTKQLTYHEKLGVFDRITQAGFSEETGIFLKMLLTNDRIGLL